MKKLRKPGLKKAKVKKRQQKEATRRLAQITDMVDAAKSCDVCNIEFCPKRNLDWNVVITSSGDVSLTCTSCIKQK